VIETEEDEGMTMGEPQLMDFSNYDIGQKSFVKTNPQTIQVYKEGYIHQREF
jgi:hypothetical protein